MATKPTDSAEDDTIPYVMYTFRDWAKKIQKQIDQMKDATSNTYATAQSALMLANTYEARISELEREHDENTTPSHEQAPTPHAPLPDSEGFWRDTDGDVWVRDIAGITMLIAKGHREGTQEIYELSFNDQSTSFILQNCGPYTKIDNPFIQGEDHAD